MSSSSVTATTVIVPGCGGDWPVKEAVLDARQSGTTARFLLPALCVGHGRFRLDGADQLRRRPLADQLDALTTLGAVIEPAGRRGTRSPST